MTLQLVLPNQPVADDPSESKCVAIAPGTIFHALLLSQMCPACTTDGRGRHLVPEASSNRSLQGSSTLDWSTTTEESPISHRCDRNITRSMRISRRRRRPRRNRKWRGFVLRLSYELLSSNSTIIFSRRYFASVSAVSYAIFLVIFGLIAFIGGAVTDQHPVPEVIFRTNIKSFDSRYLSTPHRYFASSCWRSDFVTSCFWLSTFVSMCSGPKKQSRTRRTE